ncbi:MAG: hypothetical protein WBB19_10335 [Desulforhopalus sp.]
MKPTNQKVKNSTLAHEQKSLTLEEMDLLCRKCHHLHDEEILVILRGFFRKLKKIFTQKEMTRCQVSTR